MLDPKTPYGLDPRLEELLRRVVHDCIDIGARCQKARTFAVAEAGQPVRSVYDVATESILTAARETLSNEHT